MTSASSASHAPLLATCIVLMAGCSESTTRDTDTGGALDGGRDGGVIVDSGTDGGADASIDASSIDASSIDSGADGGGAADGGRVDGGGRVPANHRADDSECRATAPPGNCSFGGGGFDCSADSDCTAGTNGRCNMNLGGAAFCRCTYDTCAGDSACPTAQTCACHGATFHADGNECIAGNCRLDSDCGPGGFCSPTIGGCGGLVGYYCHTATDLCIDDADCTSGSLEACQYVTAASRWECVARLFCP